MPVATYAMTKTLSLMQERILGGKHSFRRSASGQAKPQKSRYERRKIRGFLRADDWTDREGDELSNTV